MKDTIYLGSSAKDIEAFSVKARQRIATALYAINANIKLNPKELKYMPTVGIGVYELRIKADKQYRIFFIAKFKEAIYVLHAFTKKTQQTASKEIELGAVRYKALLNEKRERKYD